MSRILQTQSIKDKGMIEEGKDYVRWNTDLSSLSLPDKFDLTFGEQDYFFKDGKDCRLQDFSVLVGSPPPEYSKTISPPFIEGDARRGQECEIGGKNKFNSPVPSEASGE